MPWRCRRAARSRAAAWRRLRRVGGQHRVDAVVHVLGERARVLAGDRRHDVARPVGGQLRAQHDRAAREVAAEPARAAHDLHRVHVRPRAQLLEERAAQVLLDLLARLLDGDLGQAGHRREVQELERLAVGLAEQQHAPDRLVARGDRDLAADLRRHRGRAAARAVADVAAQRADVGRGARRQRRRAEPRDRRSPRASPPPPPPARPPARAPRRPAPRPPSSGGRSAGARREAAGRPCRAAPRLPSRGQRPLSRLPYAFACAAKSGWACSVSSPDSPVRIR